MMQGNGYYFSYYCFVTLKNESLLAPGMQKNIVKYALLSLLLIHSPVLSPSVGSSSRPRFSSSIFHKLYGNLIEMRLNLANITLEKNAKA